jgi:hypothetical protein
VVQVHADFVADLEVALWFRGWHENSLALLCKDRHMVHDCGNGFMRRLSALAFLQVGFSEP